MDAPSTLEHIYEEINRPEPETVETSHTEREDSNISPPEPETTEMSPTAPEDADIHVIIEKEINRPEPETVETSHTEREDGNISPRESKTTEMSPTAPEDADIHVIIAGLPRSGKSTALNNIFDLNFEAMLSATAVTKKVTSKVLTKNGVTLHVVDTPGLRDIDVKEKTVLLDMKKLGINRKFLLLLTLSVSESSSINPDYLYILKNLTAIFGENIWDRCICLLTFSDSIYESCKSEQDVKKSYQRHLKDHCKVLQQELVKLNVKKEVRVFFEYSSPKEFKHPLNGIVAIPVAKLASFPTKHLLPGQPWTRDHNWTKLASLEIFKFTETMPEKERSKWQKCLIHLRYKLYAAGGGGGFTAGVVLGGEIGARAGISGGLPGRLIGAAVGGVVGGAAGAAVGAGGTAAFIEYILYVNPTQ